MQWIDQQLKQRKMNRRQLADVIPGMTETKLSLSMSGQRKLSADEADAIRRHFGYQLPDDPIDTPLGRIHEQLAMLGDSQIHSVALYLEALTGNAPERQQA
jgi:hypothetical protein